MINITKIQRDIPERINSRRHTPTKESHAILRLANSHVPLTVGRLRSHDSYEKFKKAIGLKKNIKCLLLPIGICKTLKNELTVPFAILPNYDYRVAALLTQPCIFCLSISSIWMPYFSFVMLVLAYTIYDF